MTCTTDSRSQYAHPGRADVEWPVVRAVVDDFQQQLKKQHEDTALKAKLTAEEERAVTFVLAHLKPEATQAPRDKHKAKKAGQRAPFGAVTAEERSAEQRKHVAERKQMHVLWATNPTALQDYFNVRQSDSQVGTWCAGCGHWLQSFAYTPFTRASEVNLMCGTPNCQASVALSTLAPLPVELDRAQLVQARATSRS